MPYKITPIEYIKMPTDDLRIEKEHEVIFVQSGWFQMSLTSAENIISCHSHLFWVSEKSKIIFSYKI